MKDCKRCGKTLDDNAQFCPECGQNQNEPPEDFKPQSQKIGILSIIMWVICGIFVILALGQIVRFKFPAALLLLLIAFLFCPMASDILYKLTGKKLPKALQGVLIVVLVVVVPYCIGASKNSEKQTAATPEITTEETTVTTEITTAEETTTTETTTEAITTEFIPELLEAYIESEAIQAESGLTVFKLTTNLPDETELMITISSEAEDYRAQGHVTIQDGKAESEEFGFKGGPFPEGEYNLSITMSLPALQSDNVRAIIGEKGEYLAGDIVEYSSTGSSNVIKKEEIITIGEVATTTEEPTAADETTAVTTEEQGITSVSHGELLSVIENEINGRSVLVIKTKIKSSYNNRATITQNFFNVEDIILHHGGTKYDEIQYWAVADMADGSESKVVAFTIDKTVIDLLYNKKIPANMLDEYASDVYILPSLLKE